MTILRTTNAYFGRKFDSSFPLIPHERTFFAMLVQNLHSIEMHFSGSMGLALQPGNTGVLRFSDLRALSWQDQHTPDCGKGRPSDAASRDEYREHGQPGRKDRDMEATFLARRQTFSFTRYGRAGWLLRGYPEPGPLGGLSSRTVLSGMQIRDQADRAATNCRHA